MAERSKALVLGTSLFGGVGSNPTPIISFSFLLCGRTTLMNKNEYVAVTEGVSRLAQLVERKTLNLVVVGSSPTVGAYFYFYFPTCNLGTLPRPCGHPSNQLW